MNLTIKSYVHQVAIGLDQLMNTIIGGMADETLSARVYRNSKRSRTNRIIMAILDLVFSPIKRDHCKKSYMNEVTRKQLPEEYKK